MSKKTTETSETATLLRALNLQPIAFQPIYKIITGSFSGGILLSQIMYWYSKMNRPFYKTDEDFAKELYMSIKEFRTAKSKLENVPFIKTYRKGVPAKTHYEVGYDVYYSTMKQLVGRLPQMGQSLDAQMGGTCLSQMGQTITETTAETTAEIKSIVANATEGGEESSNPKLNGDEQEPQPQKRVRPRYSEAYERFWKACGKGSKANGFKSWKRESDMPAVGELIELHALYKKHCLTKDRSLKDTQGWISGRFWETAWNDETNQQTKVEWI